MDEDGLQASIRYAPVLTSENVCSALALAAYRFSLILIHFGSVGAEAHDGALRRGA